MTYDEFAKALGAFITLMSIINGFLKDSETKSWIGKAINFLSLLTRSDAPGTFKPMFSTGKTKGLKGAPTLKAVNLIPLMLFAAMLNACAYCQKAENKTTFACKTLSALELCGPNIAASVLSVLPELISGDTASALAQLEAKFPGEYTCILAAFENAAEQKYGRGSPAYQRLVDAAERVALGHAK